MLTSSLLNVTTRRLDETWKFGGKEYVGPNDSDFRGMLKTSEGQIEKYTPPERDAWQETASHPFFTGAAAIVVGAGTVVGLFSLGISTPVLITSAVVVAVVSGEFSLGANSQFKDRDRLAQLEKLTKNQTDRITSLETILAKQNDLEVDYITLEVDNSSEVLPAPATESDPLVNAKTTGSQTEKYVPQERTTWQKTIAHPLCTGATGAIAGAGAVTTILSLGSWPSAAASAAVVLLDSALHGAGVNSQLQDRNRLKQLEAISKQQADRINELETILVDNGVLNVDDSTLKFVNRPEDLGNVNATDMSSTTFNFDTSDQDAFRTQSLSNEHALDLLDINGDRESSG